MRTLVGMYGHGSHYLGGFTMPHYIYSDCLLAAVHRAMWTPLLLFFLIAPFGEEMLRNTSGYALFYSLSTLEVGEGMHVRGGRC